MTEIRHAAPARCSDVPEADVLAALRSGEECRLLLERIGMMPSALTAARALLQVLARVATPACTWLEGELAVELFDEQGGTNVRVMAEIGAGLRECVLPMIVVRQPLAELTPALAAWGDLAGPLRIARVSSRCVLLLASDEEDAPGSRELDISETSLNLGTGAAPTAEEVDSGWDDASVA